VRSWLLLPVAIAFVFGLFFAYQEGKEAGAKDPVAPDYVAKLAEAYCQLDIETALSYAANASIKGHIKERMEALKDNRWTCRKIEFIDQSIADQNGNIYYFYNLWTGRGGSWVGFEFNDEGKLIDVDY
jgi:hypothetical protein